VKALREQTNCLHLCQYFLPDQLEETARACLLPALTMGNPHQVLSLPAWAVRSGWFAPYSHVQMSSIWQVWLEFVHLCTEGSEIPVELSVIEWPQFHLNRLWSPYDPSRKPKERRKPRPHCVGIGGWKVAVADPHDEISQCDLADGTR